MIVATLLCNTLVICGLVICNMKLLNEICLLNSACVDIPHWLDPWLDDWLAIGLAPLKCVECSCLLDSVMSSLEFFNSFSFFQGTLSVSLFQGSHAYELVI